MSTEKDKVAGGATLDVESVVTQCVITERMIDITAKQLIGLRTQCTTTEGLTQKLICETETKLIKLFGKQLIAKRKLALDPMPDKLHKYPSAEQWLHIVGINDSIAKSLSSRDLTMENLLDMTDPELGVLMSRYDADTSDVNKLTTALANLRVWTDKQVTADKASTTGQDLHWSSYKSASSSPHTSHSPGYSQRPSTSSLPPDLPQDTPLSEPRRRNTPPPTPPLVKPSSKGKFPTTPPPHRRNKLYPANVFPPLTKSKSHESQLANKVNQESNVDITKYTMKKPENLSLGGSQEMIHQRKPSSEGIEQIIYQSRIPSGPTSPLISSPRRSPPYKASDHIIDGVHPRKNQLAVPISPNNPIGPRVGNMKHAIAHRFSNTIKIPSYEWCHRQILHSHKPKMCKFQTKVIISTCDLCTKPVFRGKVCRECKAKYHKECAQKAAPACGLPQELLTLYLESLSTGDGSPNMMRRESHNSMLSEQHGLFKNNSTPTFHHHAHHHGGVHGRPGLDSSSATSSCASSTPSSPAFIMPSSPPSTPHPSPQIHITDDNHSQFTFPDVDNSSYIGTIDSIGTISSSSITLDNYRADVVNTNTSNDSDKSDKTLIDTNSSSDRPAMLDRVDSQESTEDGLQTWTRVNSISITLKEWDIPFEELLLGEEIGTGRFGTVYKGKWHGEVAIKMLKTDPDRDNQAQLQAFKLEIAMLRKTRHENLVLFMGACMKQPHLAIVTSLCRGYTLFTHIHRRREKFTINRAIIIACQIAQGMGYLHAKGIIHRDLKSKNVFLEGGKVIITDFGLFSVTKLCHGSRKGEWLSIPQWWLCYLSPEIVRVLSAWNRVDRDLPFTEASDVYAFGTVWFELLAGDMPYKAVVPEVVIWQVGKGMKQSLNTLQASRDVKDILMLCWDFHPDERPTFQKLLKVFDKLPKKRLARSPSHPIQLSRSAESVF